MRLLRIHAIPALDVGLIAITRLTALLLPEQRDREDRETYDDHE